MHNYSAVLIYSKYMYIIFFWFFALRKRSFTAVLSTSILVPTCPLSTYYAANLNLLHKIVAYILHILGIIPPESRLRLVGTEVYFISDVSDPIQ